VWGIPHPQWRHPGVDWQCGLGDNPKYSNDPKTEKDKVPTKISQIAKNSGDFYLFESFCVLNHQN
jgi:hypothetical protein